MGSQQLSGQIINAYDDNGFIRVDDSRREELQAGSNSRPTHGPVPPGRLFEIKALPQEPLLLFQQFLPISLVESWVSYTNTWVHHQLEQHENGTYRLKPQSRLLTWKPTSVAEIYTWLAILIYMRIHGAPQIKDYWKIPGSQDIRPLHSVVKWMPYNRFQLLSRHLHNYDPTTINKDADTSSYGLTSSRDNAWFGHTQRTTAVFYMPGTSIAVDEGMVRLLGRSLEATTVPSKPIPTGFRIRAVAQRGYSPRWIWYRPGRKSGPGGVRPTYRRMPSQLRQVRQRRQLREGDTIHPNPTKVVVGARVNLLPKSTYHVFRRLRQRGHEATATARRNCGIYNPLVKLISIPSVAEYNNEVKSIDQGNQMQPNCDRRVRRGGWKAQAWDSLLEIALVNSFKLQKEGHPQWKQEKSQVNWRQRLVNDLIAKYEPNSHARQRFRTGDESTPVLQHKWVRNKNPAACKACKGIRVGEGQPRLLPLQTSRGNGGKRIQSRYGCRECRVSLCRTGNCWDFYHRIN